MSLQSQYKVSSRQQRLAHPPMKVEQCTSLEMITGGMGTRETLDSIKLAGSS